MRYFVVSDIHSSYKALKKCLDEVNYDKDNPLHTLIINGDLFDRGDEPLEVYDFLSSIPSNNLVLIRGNHEDLYLELLDKDYPDDYDYHNGTVKTFLILAGIDITEAWTIHELMGIPFNIDSYLSKVNSSWLEVKEKVKKHPITEFLKSDKWLNYYEFDKYIITHGFLPIRYSLDWRNDKDNDDWKEAHFDYAIDYMNNLKAYISDKTLIVGHLHSCYYHASFDVLAGGEDDDSIYHSNNLYVIDTNVMRSGRVEPLVIDESFKVARRKNR